MERFRQAFGTLGYTVCDDAALEQGVEKIAIYVDQGGEPTHAARQLETGLWTSKLGSMQDIEHETLGAIEGGLYGEVVLYMARNRQA